MQPRENANTGPVLLCVTPNPVVRHVGTDFTYTFAVHGHVNLSIYNALGQRVRTLVDMVQSKGTHRLFWKGDSDDGEQLAAGVYFYRLTVGVSSQSGKILIIE